MRLDVRRLPEQEQDRRMPLRTNELQGRLTAGPDVFQVCQHAMDDLHSRCGVELTQRRLWQQTWLDLHPDAHVWCASVMAGGRMEGVLVLHETVGPEGERFVRALCPRGDDRLSPAVTSPAAARELARTAAAALMNGDGRRWRLLLGPAPAPDPLLGELHDILSGSELLAGASIPQVDPAVTRQSCADGRNDLCLSPNLQRNLRKSVNRLAADGRSAHIDVVSDAEGIESWLDRAWTLRCDRDAFVGRSHADPRRELELFWRRSLRAHADLGVVELSLLHIDEHLAAYVVALDEPEAYRVLEGRFNSALARYYPGRLLEADMVRRVACRGGRPVDWMNGVAPEKLVAATTLEPTQWLHAAG
jgi:hypothetical protein